MINTARTSWDFFRRVNKEGAYDRVILSDALLDWLDKNVRPGISFTDNWTSHQHNSTVSTLINAIIVAVSSGFTLSDTWVEVIERARDQNIMVKIITNMSYIQQGRMSKEDLQREWDWSANVDVVNDKEHSSKLDKRGQAYFYHMRALLAERLHEDGKHEDVVENLNRSLEIFPDASNQVLLALLGIYKETEEYCKVLGLSNRFYPEASKMPPGLLKDVRTARRKAVCPAS